MEYEFSAKGHLNILATHKATLEITKDSKLSRKGDCIVAVGADFAINEIQKIILGCSNGGKIKITLAAAGITEEITAVANKGFCDENEIVLRKGSFLSERTLGIHSDKAADGLKKELVAMLKDEKTLVSVIIATG